MHHHPGALRVVSVSADVKKEVAPDLATVRIYLDGKSNTRDECVSEYNSRFAAIKEELVNRGVDAEDIKNGAITLNPNREATYKKKFGTRTQLKEYKTVSYSYSATITIKVDAPFDILSGIWNGLMEADEDVAIDISYSLKDQDAARDALLAVAVQECARKAKVMAEAAGCELGLPVSISHGTCNFYSGGSNSRSSLFSSAKACSVDFGAALYDDYCCDYEDSEDPFMKEDTMPDFNPSNIRVSCSAEGNWEVLPKSE